VISPIKLVGKIHHVRFQPSSAHSDNWPGDEASPFLEGTDSFPRPNQVPVVQTLDHSAIHGIKVYPVDNAINFPSICPLDSYLPDGQRYPTLKQSEPDIQIKLYTKEKKEWFLANKPVHIVFVN